MHFITAPCLTLRNSPPCRRITTTRKSSRSCCCAASTAPSHISPTGSICRLRRPRRAFRAHSPELLALQPRCLQLRCPLAAEAPMKEINLAIAALAVATALSAAGYAAAKGGGGSHGGGHGGGGHGGGPFHGGGHGGGHFGGSHFGGRRIHFGGGRHFGGRSFARPGFRGNRAFAVH